MHDWQDWADEYTHTILARKQERFANGDLPRTGRLNQTERKKFNEAVVANKVLSPKSEKLHSQPDSLTENSASGPLPYHTGVHTIPVTVPVPVPGPHAPNRVVAERQSDSALSTGVDDPAPFFAKVTLSPAEETAKWSASTYRDFWNGHVSADLRLTTIPKKWVQAIDGFRERRGLTPATFLEALKEMERTEPIQSTETSTTRSIVSCAGEHRQTDAGQSRSGRACWSCSKHRGNGFHRTQTGIVEDKW